MQSCSTPLSRLAVLAGSFLLPLLAAAQPAPSPAPPNSELVTLPDFSVTTTAASDYIAAESTTGTRVAAKILDLPFSVNVLTADFMDDFNALDFRDQLAYTSNVTGYEVLSTGYGMRGFDADVQLRNGFRRIGLIDKVNIERVEVIKGPAASIYGSVLPGGTINYITRKPKTKPEQRVSYTYGANELMRAQLSSTGPLGGGGQLFYRVDAAGQMGGRDQPFKEQYQSTASFQLQWKPSSATSLLFEAEWLERRENGMSAANVPILQQAGVLDPYRVQPATGTPRTYTRNVGLALELFDFNDQGPHNYSNRFVKTLTATLEHRISEVFSFRSSANWFDRGLVRQEVGARGSFNPVTRTESRGTARFRPFPEGGGSWQNDLLASFTTGSVKHKLLLTLDYQKQTQEPQQFDAATNAAFPAAVATGLKVDNPDYNFVRYADNPALYTTIQDEESTIDIYGAFLSERATLLDGRLNVLAGVRYDNSRSKINDKLLATNASFSTEAVTYQTGFSYRVIPALSVYANTSSSFTPQFSLGTNVDGTTFQLPNEEGEGWEAGLKASIFTGRLTFTAGYFDISRSNVATETTDIATGRLVTLISGKQASKGTELDFSWVVTPGLQFFGGYGYTDSKILSSDATRFLVGGHTRRTPLNTLGVGGKYEFKEGRAKGLFVTAGYRHVDESIVNPGTGRNISVASVTATNPFVNNPLPNGLLPFPQFASGAVLTSIPYAVRVDNGSEAITNAPYDLVEGGIGYKWKSGRYRSKVQVNVNNILDERYTFGSAGQGQRRNFAVTYDLTF